MRYRAMVVYDDEGKIHLTVSNGRPLVTFDNNNNFTSSYFYNLSSNTCDAVTQAINSATSLAEVLGVDWAEPITEILEIRGYDGDIHILNVDNVALNSCTDSEEYQLVMQLDNNDRWLSDLTGFGDICLWPKNIDYYIRGDI